MKPSTKINALMLMAVLLPGCAMLGPDYQRPAFSLPALFGEETATETQMQLTAENPWWTHYQDTILNELVAKALENNTDIKQAVARIEEADAFMREVGSALLPRIDLDAAGSRSRITELGPNPQFVGSSPIRENYNIRLGTSFELDFWGKLRRAKESARAQALASRYARDTVALSLAGLVASNYLQLRSLDSQIAVSEDNLRIRNESLELTRRRLEGGVSSALDVHQAEVASSALAAHIVELKRQRAISQHQLALLTG